MSTARDELMAIIAKCFRIHPNGVAYIAHTEAADAIIAAGYTKPDLTDIDRTITTVEELDALPIGTRITDSDPEVCVKEQYGWRGTALYLYESDELTLPVTVMHVPEATA